MRKLGSRTQLFFAFNGQVTNNGPDTRTISIYNENVLLVNVVVFSNSTVSFSLPHQLAEGMEYIVTASASSSPTLGDPALSCMATNGSGTMVARPRAVSNVTVICQVGTSGFGAVPQMPSM